MPVTAIQFQINPAFMAMLKQQPTGSASLDSELRAIRTVFTQQEDALRRGSNVGISVLPTIEQTDSLLTDLQATSHQWNEQPANRAGQFEPPTSACSARRLTSRPIRPLCRMRGPRA